VLASMFLALVVVVSQDAPKDEAVKLKAALDQAKACAKATVDGDFAKVIDMTNPIALKTLGGKEMMLKQITAAMEQMKQQGVAIKGTTVEPAKSLTRSASTIYCVLPTTTIITVQQQKVTATGFLLGSSTDDGKTWTYLDGSSGEAAVRTLLPDVPKDMTFPAKTAPKVEKIAEEKPKS
jgi:hypothetical protein